MPIVSCAKKVFFIFATKAYQPNDCIGTLTPILIRKRCYQQRLKSKVSLRFSLTFDIELPLTPSHSAPPKSCSFSSLIMYQRSSRTLVYINKLRRRRLVIRQNGMFSMILFSFIFVRFPLILDCAVPPLHSSISLARNHLKKANRLLELEALECRLMPTQKANFRRYETQLRQTKRKRIEKERKAVCCRCVSDKKKECFRFDTKMCAVDVHIYKHHSHFSMFPYFFSRAFETKRRGHETRKWESASKVVET